MYRGPVIVEVPAEHRALRVLRLMASDAGRLAGFGYDRIEDARLAVSEAATVLIGSGGPARLTCRLTADEHVLLVDISADPAPEPWPGAEWEGSLEQRVLTAVADTVGTVVDGGPGLSLLLRT